MRIVSQSRKGRSSVHVSREGHRQLLLRQPPGTLLQHLFDAYAQAGRAASVVLGEDCDDDGLSDFHRSCVMRDVSSCPPEVPLREHLCARVQALGNIDYPFQTPPSAQVERSFVGALEYLIERSLREREEIDLLPLLIAHGNPRHVQNNHRYADAKTRTERLADSLEQVASDALGSGSVDWFEIARAAATDLRGCRSHLFFSKNRSFRPWGTCKRPFCPSCELSRSRKMRWAYCDFLQRLDRDPAMRGVDVAAVLTMGQPVDTAGVAGAVDRAQAAFKRLTRLSAWRDVLGYVTVLHVVREPDRRWHPHVHVVLRLRPGTDPAAVLAGWPHVLRLDRVVGGVRGTIRALDYAVADAKRSGAGRDLGGYPDGHFIDDTDDDDLAFALLFSSVMRGVHRFRTAGCFRGCFERPVSEDELTDPVWVWGDLSRQPASYAEPGLYGMVFRWRGGGVGYRSVPYRPRVPSALSRARELLRGAARSIPFRLLVLAVREQVEKNVLHLGKKYTDEFVPPETVRFDLVESRPTQRSRELCMRTLPVDVLNDRDLSRHFLRLPDQDLALFTLVTSDVFGKTALRLVQLSLLQRDRPTARRQVTLGRVRARAVEGVVLWYVGQLGKKFDEMLLTPGPVVGPEPVEPVVRHCVPVPAPPYRYTPLSMPGVTARSVRDYARWLQEFERDGQTPEGGSSGDWLRLRIRSHAAKMFGRRFGWLKRLNVSFRPGWGSLGLASLRFSVSIRAIVDVPPAYRVRWVGIGEVGSGALGRVIIHESCLGYSPQRIVFHRGEAVQFGRSHPDQKCQSPPTDGSKNR